MAYGEPGFFDQTIVEFGTDGFSVASASPSRGRSLQGRLFNTQFGDGGYVGKTNASKLTRTITIARPRIAPSQL